jgi:hypothetical protein
MISDVLNIPAQVRGQITDYTSKSQLQSSQIQSTKGLSYLFKNFLMFEKELLSYSADLFKIMAPNDESGRDSLSLIVGDGMAEMLSMDVVKRMSFEDFLINLNPNDYMSAETKQELAQLAFQSASSGMPTVIMKNYIKIKQSETLTEAYNYTEQTMFKEQEREDAKMAQEQELAMINNQNNNATQERITDKNIDAGLEKQRMADQTKITTSLIGKQGNKSEK